MEELLGVTIDSNLHFKEHVLSLCKKANCELHALSPFSKYMTLKKRRILMKSFYNFNWKKEGVHVDYNLQGYYNLRHATGGGRRSMIKVILNSKNILYNYQDFSWSILHFAN